MYNPQVLKTSFNRALSTGTKAKMLPEQDLLQERRHLSALLSDFTEGRINKQSFMASVISWSYEFILAKGGYLPQLITMKPMAVVEFDKLTQDEVKELSSGSLQKVREIKSKWLNDCRKSRVYNNSDRLWLVKMLSYYTYKEDVVKMEEINKRLKLYEGTV